MAQRISWLEEYISKCQYLGERYNEVRTREFYRTVFPEGELDGFYAVNKKGCGVLTRLPNKSGEDKPYQVELTDSLGRLVDIESKQDDPRYWFLTTPISYWGTMHKKSMSNSRLAHALFALVIDVDYVTARALRGMLKEIRTGSATPAPSYVVVSGKGVHLYFLLKYPHEMKPQNVKYYSAVKRCLSLWWWRRYSENPQRPDADGLYQPYRCVGTRTKEIDGQYGLARAYRITDNRYTVEEIASMIPPSGDYPNGFQYVERKRMPLEEAKKKYPLWYQERIVEGKPKRKEGSWRTNEAAYNYFLERMRRDIRQGARYYSIVCLCAFGVKCGIPNARIRRDALGIVDHYDSLTEDQDHFTVADAEAALKRLRHKNRLLRMTRRNIETLCKIDMTPKISRKGNEQKLHLAIARATLKVKIEQGLVTVGRPSEADNVEEWRRNNPHGRKADCARDLGISLSTVRRHWTPTRQEQLQRQVRKVHNFSEAASFLDGLSEEELKNLYLANRELFAEMERTLETVRDDS